MPLATDNMALFRSMPLIASMTASSQEDLASQTLFQIFPAGVRLIEEGHQPDMLFLIAEGLAAVRAARRGNTTTFLIVGPRAAVPLTPVVSDRPSDLVVDTIQRTRAFLIPAKRLRELAFSQATFLYALLDELAKQHQETLDSLVSQRLDVLPQRLANFILARVDPLGRFRLPYPKSELAQLLGTTPETLSRGFVILTSIGVTTSRTGEIQVRDVQMLRAYVENQPSDGEGV